MALTAPQSQETALVGRIVQSSVSATDLTIYAAFEDKKTGVARTPQAGTLLFTIDKDTEKFEMIKADSHSTTDGITTITVNANGRALNKYGNLVGSSSGFSHAINAEIGCADVHIPLEVLNEIIRGDEGTASNNFRIGDETNSDITVYAQNADGNKPFVRYDASEDKWIFSNDGVSSTDMGGGTGSITGGDGITITAGVVAVDTTDTTKFAKASGDAAENKAVVLNASSYIDPAFYDPSVLFTGITTHSIYTPAFLTGGSSAEGTFSNWLAVLDGSFRITVDGSSYNVDGIDFTGVTSMNDVASYIQTALRAATSGAETVVWSTDHFVITSGDTTSSSAISVTTTSTGTVGTDISGAGASDWMDCDTGNGVVTNAVLDKSADSGKIVVLDSNGVIAATFLDEAAKVDTLTAKGSIYAASAASTPAELAVGTDGEVLVADSGESTGLNWSKTYTKTGVLSKDLTDASTTQDVTGLGFEPDYIEFEFRTEEGTGIGQSGSNGSGVYDASDSANKCVYTFQNFSGSTEQIASATDATKCMRLYTTETGATGEKYQSATVSATASGQFTITWTKNSTPTGTGYVLYKAYKLLR